MSPDLGTLNIRCYSNPTNSVRMSSRGTGMQKDGGGFESKGLILLLICGFYAVFLFVVARLFTYAASKILSPGEIIYWNYFNGKKIKTEFTLLLIILLMINWYLSVIYVTTNCHLSWKSFKTCNVHYNRYSKYDNCKTVLIVTIVSYKSI